MKSYTAVFLILGTCYATLTFAIGDLEFFNEETEFLQDQLDHYAKADPNGLEALRNGIEAALIKNSFTRDTRQMGITGDNLMDFLYNQYQSVFVTPRPTLARLEFYIAHSH
jgi:hypothetical protein